MHEALSVRGIHNPPYEMNNSVELSVGETRSGAPDIRFGILNLESDRE